MKVNWWEIGDNQNLHLNHKELDLLRKIIVERYGSLHVFCKKLSLGTALYNKLKYKNQGISIYLLKRILRELNVPLEGIGNFPIKIGKYKFIEAKFPIKINPSFGEILAHSFFDGYVDEYIMRYSNYDPEIKKEFCLCANDFIKGVKIPINKPENIRRDINLPTFVPQLLKSLFSTNTFLGSKCRIPRRFIELVRKEEKFGWYFLKGGYLDEGTTASGEVLILTGIKNKFLVKDTQKIAKILGLSTKIRTKESRKGYYELKLNAKSLERFYENISTLFFAKVAKWDRVSERVRRRRIIKERSKRIKEECKKILQVCEEKGKLTLLEIMRICRLPESTAYFRVHLLVYNENLEKRREGKKNEYIFKNSKLLTLPLTNEMRRRFGWR